MVNIMKIAKLYGNLSNRRRAKPLSEMSDKLRFDQVKKTQHRSPPHPRQLPLDDRRGACPAIPFNPRLQFGRGGADQTRSFRDRVNPPANSLLRNQFPVRSCRRRLVPIGQPLSDDTTRRRCIASFIIEASRLRPLSPPGAPARRRGAMPASAGRRRRPAAPRPARQSSCRPCRRHSRLPRPP